MGGDSTSRVKTKKAAEAIKKETVQLMVKHKLALWRYDGASDFGKSAVTTFPVGRNLD